MLLGHQIIGSGSIPVFVIHDWFCDCSSYDPILPYLDTENFTYAFVDLRGYGRSKSLSGLYNLNEAAHDLLILADSLKWQEFHLIGHSMSSMIAQYLALEVPERVKSIVNVARPASACRDLSRSCTI